MKNQTGPEISAAAHARMMSKSKQVMEEMGQEFMSELPNLMQGLIAAIDAGDVEDIKRRAYTLKSNAGGFGWPLIGQGAGFLHLAMEKGKPGPELFALAKVFLKKLETLNAAGDGNETEEGIALIKSMYHELDSLGMMD